MRKGQSRGAPLEPIARWEPGIDGDVLMMDPTAVRLHFGISERTVRRRCEPSACDVTTRAPLYDEQEAAARLAGVRARPGGTAAARRTIAAARFQMAT